jgi:N-glycosylase/DNA lyase
MLTLTNQVENLCITFGTPHGQLGETPYYDFPPPSQLTPASVEGKLRNLGFGYRAKFIHQTAQIVAARGEDWLHGLRHVPYREAHEALLELQGVGPKVADCVCLMSLDKKESVPVDTHGMLYQCSRVLVSRSRVRANTDLWG